MTAETFASMLGVFLAREPFRAFTVELRSGHRFEVDLSRSVVYRDGQGIFLPPGPPSPIYFDHESVVKFIDAPTKPG